MSKNKIASIICNHEDDKLRVTVERTGQAPKSYRQVTDSSCNRINDLIIRRKNLNLDIAGVVQPDWVGLGIFNKGI